MTASRSKAFWGLALVAGLMTAPVSLAQTSSGPTPLWPQGPTTSPTVAPPAGTDTAAPGPTPLGAYTPPPPRASSFEVKTLAAVTPDGGGLLDAGQGGLGQALWADSPRGLVDRALASLPQSSPSPAVRALLGRVLMSSGTAPQGAKDARNFLGARLERLALLGDGKNADAMATLPTALDDAGGAEAWARLSLLTGDGAACDQMADLQKRFNDGEIQMLGVVCQVRGGATDNIMFSLDIMREQGVKDDGFSRLAEVAAGGQKGALKGFTAVSAEAVALARAMGRGLPAEVPAAQILALNPAAAAAVADLPDTPAALKLAAGDRAASFGTLPPAALAPLYKAAKVSPNDLKNAVGVAEKRQGADQRAILYQALIGETIPSLKGAILAKAVDVSDPALLAGAWGDLLAQELEGLAPGPALKDLAPAATRLALLRNRRDLAQPWFELARQSAQDAPKDGKVEGKPLQAYLRLVPLAVLGGLLPSDGANWAQWLDAVKADADAPSRLRAASILALLTAAGEKVDPLLLARTAPVVEAPGVIPDAASWLRLDQSTTVPRRGEVAVLALAELADAGPATTTPTVTAHALSALTAVGLKDDARRLALEAVAVLAGP
ncbi:hypothetical protein [Nitrospirillum sp. BR 11163]|uniref:hypothetical protein n=1 Tax=Nitrospirillum sp. BR 11163 TaxID=3104323 RepID=UPI002AFFAB94|nr:hypothetical protein [Nitrospirillum sp. BR 11163]MEA1677359.1 hypothetical protein [Nitrospirillum sp. BR 11163]